MVLSRNALVRNAAAAALRAITSTPLVSLSRRWTSRGRSALPKRKPSKSPSRWRSDLVPPCTASPGGLLRTMTASSRCSTAACSIASSAGSSRRGVIGGRGRRRIERRDADRLARGQPVAGLGALAVDPDLPGAQQLFEPAMGQRRVMPPEPAIEAKRPILAVDGYGFDGAGHGCGFGRALAQLFPVIEALFDLALEAAFARPVESAALDARPGNSSGRRTPPRWRGRRHSPGRSRDRASAGSARSGCASAASASRSRAPSAGPRRKRYRRRSIWARSPDRSRIGRSPARPRASPAGHRRPTPRAPGSPPADRRARYPRPRRGSGGAGCRSGPRRRPACAPANRAPRRYPSRASDLCSALIRL